MRKMDGSTIGFLSGVTIIGLSTICVLLIAGGFTVAGSPRIAWETLLVGASAILAAVVTIRQVRSQIRQTDRLAREDLARKGYAARAILPLALSGLTDYTIHCIDLLADLLPKDLDEQMVIDRLIEVPPLPDDVIPSLREAIHFANDNDAKTLADLLGGLQIQHSRLRGLHRKMMNPGLHAFTTSEIAHLVIDAAEVAAGVAASFKYARRRETHVDLSKLSGPDVRQALFNSGLFDDPRIDSLVANWRLENSIFRFAYEGA